MKKRKKNKFREFLRLLRPGMILLILTVYLAICLVTWLILRGEGAEATFWDVVSFNLLAITGNDYVYVDNPWTRAIGVLVLVLGVAGLTAITGYVSSAFVARRLDPEREVRKLQHKRDHIIICGWKNDLGILLRGILRKNRDLRASDLIVINNVEDIRMQGLREDEELKGLNMLRGDFTEEQTLMKANVKEAARVLIIGENQENLDAELVDSRVFVCALMVRKLNAGCPICAEIRTERYRNYLESQRCAEVVFTDEYTRYILTTSTNYSGMSRVMSSLLDNGDGVSVQIAPVREEWIGRTYGELFSWYKREQNTLLLGVVENMGVEKELKHQILSEAQKSTNYGEIIQNLKNVRNIEINRPRLNPEDGYLLKRNMGAIILGSEI